MAIEAQFTAPLQVVATPLMRDRVKAMADAEHVSQAQIMREILDHAIAWREGVSRERMERIEPES